MVGIDVVIIIPMILMCICVIGMTFSIFMLYRNRQVFKERTKLHSKIFEQDENGEYIWSSKIFELTAEADSIATYSQMMHRFWIAPSTFYKEFLENLESKK